MSNLQRTISSGLDEARDRMVNRDTLSRRQVVVAVLGGMAAACSSRDTPSLVSPSLPSNSLISALIGGGYVLYFRHAIATVGSDTLSGEGWWRSCDDSVARQLSDIGRQQASRIGADMKALAIPIDRVISSEFCRCVETAELLELGPAIETSPDLTFFLPAFDVGVGLLERVQTPPSSGRNTVLVAHVRVREPLPELGSLDQGDAAVFRPDGSGGTTFVGYIKADEWGTFA